VISNGLNLLLTIQASTLQIKINDQLLKKPFLTIENTVEDVKRRIFDATQIPIHRQLLFSMFDHLKQYMRSHTCKLSQYNLINGMIILLEILPIKMEDIIIQLGTGKILKTQIDIGQPISSIKTFIQNREGIDIGCQIIMKENYIDQYNDQDLILNVIDRTKPILVRVLLNGPVNIDVNAIHDQFHCDFTKADDKEKSFLRGGLSYERPCGCFRIALNVAGKYLPDDKWLGMTGDDPDEWAVSYHGTGKHNAMSIAEEGYRLSKGKRFLHGMGIYSTPEIEIAKKYASDFIYQGKKYLLVIQNRVNQKYLTILDKQTTDVGTYYLSINDQVDANDMSDSCIRPYALCLFKK